MADAEDIYTSRIVVEADEAMKATLELRANIDAYKKSIQDLATRSEQSFAIVAEGIRRAAKAAREAAISGLGKEMTGEAFNARMTEINQKYITDIKALNQAVRELTQSQREHQVSAQQGFQNASVNARAYAQEIERLKAQIRSIAEQQRVSLKAAAEGLSQAGVSSRGNINEALKQLTQTTSTASGSLKSFGDVAKYVFGTLLGVTAVTAVLKFIDVIKQAINQFTQLELAQRRLEVAVRAFQRSGLNTSLSEWRDMIAEIKEQYPIFSERELTEGAAAVGLKLREFNFTVEETNNILEASAALSVINGKNFGETADLIARAMGSGNFEAVQRMGLNISRMAIASEAQAQGIKESYTAMEDSQRAHIAYNLLMEQSAVLMEDASKATDTMWAAQTQLNSAWVDFLAGLGTLSKEELPGILKSAAKLLGVLTDLLETLNSFQVKAQLTFASVAVAAEKMWTAIRTGEKGNLKQMMADLDEWRKEMFDAWHAQTYEGVSLGDTDVIPSNEDTINKLKDLGDFWMDFQEGLLEIQEEYNLKKREAEIDYTQDIEKIWRDFYDDLAQLQLDYQRKQQDIIREYFRDVADENQRYQDELAQELQRYNSRRAELERAYREREVNAERDYQEKLRRLREEFLMDLEDALHERDARQILRLIKRYNLEKAQLAREEQERKRRDRSAYEGDLANLEQQKKDRMKLLAQEHQQRLRDLSIQKQRELADARLWFEREMADLRTKHEIELNERRIKQQQEMEELQRHLQDRVNALAAKLGEEYNLTAKTMEDIQRLLNSYYGPGGSIDQIYLYAAGQIAQLISMINLLDTTVLNKQLTKGTPVPPVGGIIGGTTGTGGTSTPAVPTIPTLPGNPIVPIGQSGNGSLKVIVDTSPDLVVKIVDDAMAGVAEVMVQKRNRMSA